VEGQSYRRQEGFSLSEKDILASYNSRGVLKRDRSGKICKLGDNEESVKEIILEKESIPNDPNDPNDPMFWKEIMAREYENRDVDNNNIKKITDKMKQMEVEELKEIKAITNKLDILQVNLQNTKEKEELMNKLIDKIHTDPTYNESSKRNSSHILLIIVLFVIFAVGGTAIYYIMGSSTSDGPITYTEAVIRAKQNIMKRKGLQSL